MWEELYAKSKERVSIYEKWLRGQENPKSEPNKGIQEAQKTPADDWIVEYPENLEKPPKIERQAPRKAIEITELAWNLKSMDELRKELNRRGSRGNEVLN